MGPKNRTTNLHYNRFGTISDGTITGMHCTKCLFRAFRPERPLSMSSRWLCTADWILSLVVSFSFRSWNDTNIKVSIFLTSSQIFLLQSWKFESNSNFLELDLRRVQVTLKTTRLCNCNEPIDIVWRRCRNMISGNLFNEVPTAKRCNIYLLRYVVKIRR